jgi:hypothetical protein
MPTYHITSLVDITRTSPSRVESDKLKLSQQANFNSLVQTIGLRSNIEWEVDPVKHTGVLPLPFEGRGTFWVWEFSVEREEVFLNAQGPEGLLVDDLHNVPVIIGLSETIDIRYPVFRTQSPDKNICIHIKA